MLPFEFPLSSLDSQICLSLHRKCALLNLCLVTNSSVCIPLAFNESLFYFLQVKRLTKLEGKKGLYLFYSYYIFGIDRKAYMTRTSQYVLGSSQLDFCQLRGCQQARSSVSHVARCFLYINPITNYQENSLAKIPSQTYICLIKCPNYHVGL